MKIDRVTITGADDSVDPKDLIEITKEYPFVEWGILLSRKSGGSNRFPTTDWMKKLLEISLEHPMRLSGHLCGTWVKDLVHGNGFSFIHEEPILAHMFQRIQLNFHAIVHQIEKDNFIKSLQQLPDVQYIFQLDDVNNQILDVAHQAKINAVPLFDTSSGIGQLPESWPKIKEGFYCGYAGGLSPENLEEQLAKIKEQVGNNTIWIDVETKVRSHDDMQFDLTKVKKFLEITKKYIK